MTADKQVCPDCKGTGIVDYDDSHGEPRNAPCHCVKRPPTDSGVAQETLLGTEGKGMGGRFLSSNQQDARLLSAEELREVEERDIARMSVVKTKADYARVTTAEHDRRWLLGHIRASNTPETPTEPTSELVACQKCSAFVKARGGPSAVYHFDGPCPPYFSENGTRDPACPECGKRLKKVTYSRGSMLNEDQFDAVRAGDWYCDTCPSNGRGNTSYRYYWDRELRPADTRRTGP